jgi:elongation of very long chain fatty acids protein 6
VSSHAHHFFVHRELIDTFFIVIHKKPLIFLHWYHHITVLLYCWHSYVAMSPTGLYFVVMNYAVHSSMYFYYFLVATKSKPNWLNPMFITACQILQMIGGVSITLTGLYFQKTAHKDGYICRINSENNTAAMVMYGSYLFLFSQFFLKRYLPKGKKVKTV